MEERSTGADEHAESVLFHAISGLCRNGEDNEGQSCLSTSICIDLHGTGSAVTTQAAAMEKQVLSFISAMTGLI